MKQPYNTTIYNTALYMRLSRDDELQGESGSIQTQRMMLRQYAAEHGLSVVVPGQDRGKSYAEYTAEKQGTSYKAKLKTAIDNLIPRVKDFDELLRRLQEMGYEIKQGKYISFRAAGQERERKRRCCWSSSRAGYG